MSQFVTASQAEIEQIHTKAVRFVDRYLRDDYSPNIRAGAYPPDCTVALTHFIVPLYGAMGLRLTKEKFDVLDEWFPGAEISEERKSIDTLEGVYQLNIPITWHRSTVAGKRARRVTMDIDSDSGKPSVERALIWTVCAVATVVVLYFRLF
jgi:hypothetical protein